MPLHAGDTNLLDEIQALREQNALLQRQVEKQGEQINTLTRQFQDFSAARTDGERETEAPQNSPSVFDKVHLSGEGGFGFSATQPEGNAPDGEFRLYDARLFLDAQVWENIYFLGEIVLAYPGQDEYSLQLGELYVDFEDVSQLWNQDGQLNIRVGQVYIPFGEEYLARNASDNPLISQSLMDFWGINPGVELYGSLGKFSYVAAVQNGADGAANGFGGDKSVAARIGVDPDPHWHFSVSAMRTGDLKRGQLSAMWFGSAYFRSIGSPASSKFQVDALEADATARWQTGQVRLSGGAVHYGDNDPAADNERWLYYYSAEAKQDLTKKLYAVTRWSQIYCQDGLPVAGYGRWGQYYYGGLTDNLWRLSLGLGYDLNKHVTLKGEYSFERGYTTGGKKRDEEDFFGVQAAFKF